MYTYLPWVWGESTFLHFLVVRFPHFLDLTHLLLFSKLFSLSFFALTVPRESLLMFRAQLLCKTCPPRKSMSFFKFEINVFKCVFSVLFSGKKQIYRFKYVSTWISLKECFFFLPVENILICIRSLFIFSR